MEETEYLIQQIKETGWHIEYHEKKVKEYQMLLRAFERSLESLKGLLNVPLD